MTADPPRLLLLRGDDAWAIEREIARVATALAEATGAAPGRWRVAGRETTAEAITERVATAPLFGGGTVAVVTDPGPLVRGRAGREALERTLGGVAPGNALLLVETGDARRRPASLVELEAAVVRAGGAARACAAPRPAELPAWLRARATELGVELDPTAARELARRVGGLVAEGDVDRRAMSALAVGELEKLALLRPGSPVTAEEVAALVPEAVPASVWAFLDAVSERRATAAAELLDRILDATPEPVLLGQLGPRIRDLVVAADHLAGGGSPAELVRLLGVHPFRAEKAAAAARRWTVAELEHALEGLLELDASLKGAAAQATDRQRRLAFALWIADRVAPRAAAGR